MSDLRPQVAECKVDAVSWYNILYAVHRDRTSRNTAPWISYGICAATASILVRGFWSHFSLVVPQLGEVINIFDFIILVTSKCLCLSRLCRMSWSSMGMAALSLHTGPLPPLTMDLA